ncbi:hypothetical protein ACRAWG_00820 [Methylobacterium sp. P31]
MPLAAVYVTSTSFDRSFGVNPSYRSSPGRVPLSMPVNTSPFMTTGPA